MSEPERELYIAKGWGAPPHARQNTRELSNFDQTLFRYPRKNKVRILTLPVDGLSTEGGHYGAKTTPAECTS
jgi:hypothetical protein